MSIGRAAPLGASRRALSVVLTFITLFLGATVSVWADTAQAAAEGGSAAAARTLTTHGYDGSAKDARTYAASGKRSVVQAGGPGRQPSGRHEDHADAVSTLFAAEESGAVLSFGSKAAAREGLTGDAGTAANRFFRDATSKSQDFQAQELSGGGYRLQFFSPANNPGYGKLYVQEIDSAGNVLSEFKNAIGPDGLIETKWVHGGP